MRSVTLQSGFTSTNSRPRYHTLHVVIKEASLPCRRYGSYFSNGSRLHCSCFLIVLSREEGQGRHSSTLFRGKFSQDPPPERAPPDTQALMNGDGFKRKKSSFRTLLRRSEKEESPCIEYFLAKPPLAACVSENIAVHRKLSCECRRKRFASFRTTKWDEFQAQDKALATKF